MYFTIQKISDTPECIEMVALWFHEKWGIPLAAYQNSMQESIKCNTIPQWYYVLNEEGKMFAGAGIIENDFHERKDLYPNICALYVEEEYRKQGVAGDILEFISKDASTMGYDTIYLLTGHTSFYERYGWNFLTSVKESNGEIGRLYKFDIQKQLQPIESFWQTFLKEKALPMTTTYLESFYFGSSEKSANTLLELVLSGQKKATASSLYAFENDVKPQVGDYSIVTNWEGKPFCVIQTTTVQILPFKEMTFDICKREGEDESLLSWQHNHIHFFRQEGKQLGYEFHEEMPVIFEDFQVVYQCNDERT